MIVGIGVDTVHIARFERALGRAPGLGPRVFTDDELGMPLASRAVRFAAREAAVKALGGLHGLALRDLAVERTRLGAPRFARGPELRAVLARLGIDELHLSLTHDAEIATAFVIAERRTQHPPHPAAGGTA